MKKLSVLFLPSLFWLTLTALGFGSQSLTNLIELIALFVLSVILAFIPEKKLASKKILIFLFIITFLMRWLMPILPE